MANFQVAAIWIIYAIAVALFGLIAAVFVYIYQSAHERSATVATVAILTITALLATVLLQSVDIALVSSTTSSRLGRRKDWATQDEVDSIVYGLTIIYYALFSLDTILCLIVVPFTYFWYEERDELSEAEGGRSTGSRVWGAVKYTIGFFLLCVVLFLVGFFVPIAKDSKDTKFDFEYLRDLLSENRGERALTFALGLLTTLGIFVYVIYTGSGLALLPVKLIKSAPSVSAPSLAATTTTQLEQNRERQHQLEMRNEGRQGGLSAKDQRELDALVREERTLQRRERLAAEAAGTDRSALVRFFIKVGAVLRPLKLVGGLILLLLSLVVFASMLITGIDKAKNSICGVKCGYILGHTNILNPINFILVKSAKVFPVDYVIFILLAAFLFSATVIGLAAIEIRFLWIRLFRISKGHTTPQAMLIATVLLTISALAINYAMAMLIAPQYSHFGPQTFCDLPYRPGDILDCSDYPENVVLCSEATDSAAAKAVCTPSVISTFLDRMSINFSFFGIVDFWAQFFFLGVFLIVFLTSLFRVPKLDEEQLTADEEEEEEEGLLASTGRRFNATWQDITGRPGKGRQTRADDNTASQA